MHNAEMLIRYVRMHIGLDCFLAYVYVVGNARSKADTTSISTYVFVLQTTGRAG